jgi:putative transcriptional regulator
MNTGKLLIAPPAVKGNFWYKTVVLLTENHMHGSVGLVLNKRSQMSVKEFGEQLGMRIELPGYVYLGGPVNVKNLSFLHTSEWVSKNTMRVTPEISVSSAEDILPRLAMGDCPKRWRLFLGLCGWGPDQLDNELKGNPPFSKDASWITATPTLDLIFGPDNKEQWCEALDHSAQEFAQNIL